MEESVELYQVFPVLSFQNLGVVEKADVLSKESDVACEGSVSAIRSSPKGDLDVRRIT